MSKNIKQVYDAAPITTNASTDLIYFGRSPYGATDDKAMLYSSFAAQFATPAQIQNQSFSFGTATGTANAHVVTLSPAPTSYVNGMRISYAAPGTNTSSTVTVNVNGLGNKNILYPGGLPIGAIQSFFGIFGYAVEIEYNAAFSNFILLNPMILQSVFGWTTAVDVQNSVSNKFILDGVADAYTGTISLTNTGGSAFWGSVVIGTTAPATNAGASTLAVTGIGSGSAIQIKKRTIAGLVDLDPGDIVSGGNYYFSLVWGGSSWQLLNPQSSPSPFVSGTGNFSARGISSLSGGQYAISFGTGSAIGDYSLAFGNGCTANGASSYALGNLSSATNEGSVVWTGFTSTPQTDSNADQWINAFKNGYKWFLNSGVLPLSIDVSGNIISSLGAADQSKTIVTPMAADTVTLVTTNKLTIINPAGTLATLTVDMPATPINGQLQTVSFTQIITALTVTGGGNTIIGQPTAAIVGQSFTMVYNSGDTTWYPG